MKAAVTVLLAIAAFAFLATPGPATASNPDGMWVQVPQPLAPLATDGGAMCWDPVRGRMVVFGGRSTTGARNDVWAVTSGPPVRWEQLSPLGTPPSPRYAHTMVYDSLRDRMIVYGGSPNTNSPLGDVFELTLSGTPTWNPIAAANPPPARLAAVAIYDPIGDRMIVFGGLSGFDNLGDTWQLSFASGTPTWTELVFSDPTPGKRSWSAAIYDPVEQRMVISGGGIGEGPPRVVYGGDVWALSLTGTPAWNKLPVVGTLAGGRRGHAAMYDSDHRWMVLFGGWNGSSWRSDVSVLDLDNMSLSPATAQTEWPWECERACLAYDPVAKRGVLFGGGHGTSGISRAWSLSLTPDPWWSHLEPAPPPRNGSAAVYDPTRRELVQFGGKSNFGSPQTQVIEPDQDTWSLSLTGDPIWHVLAAPGTPVPSPRDGPTLVRDPAHDRLLMFGGSGPIGECPNDLWSFDLSSRQWSQLTPAGPLPPGRYYAGGAFDPVRSRLFIFSSENFGVLLDDLWELDFEPTLNWTRLSTVGPKPSSRFSPAMLYDSLRDRILLFGGVNVDGSTPGDTWALSLGSTPAWTQLVTFGAPLRGAGTTTVYDSARDRLLVFGGHTNFGETNTVYALALSGAPVWSQLNPTGTLPPPRSYGVAVYDAARDRMIITQGQGSGFRNDTWSLEFGDQPTATLLTLVEEQVTAGAIRLTWFSADGPGQSAVAQRSSDGFGWTDIGALVSDASGQLILEDRIPAGGRVAYRIVMGERFTDAHWVTVPASLQFGITATGANPSRGGLPITFALSNDGAAALDLYAISGRRVLHRELAGLGVGVHTVDLASGAGLANGLYLLELTQGAKTSVRKVVIAR